MLGTMFTSNRDRTKLIDFGVPCVNGWIFASVYAAVFESWRRATWWLGGAIGPVHALYALGAPILGTVVVSLGVAFPSRNQKSFGPRAQYGRLMRCRHVVQDP
jgi:hypothetical protein